LFRIIGRWFVGERDTNAVTEEPAEDFFEPAMGELSDEDFESLDFAEAVTEKALKARSDGEQRNDWKCSACVKSWGITTWTFDDDFSGKFALSGRRSITYFLLPLENIELDKDKGK
jgi:hypothetical protein